MREAFNLTALQELLKKHPRYKDLAKGIGRFVGARSFQRDLRSAQASLSALAEIDQTDGQARAVFGQALMTHAVIMYCRAAIEDGNGRFKMGVTKGFSPEQEKNHKGVVRLRNRSIAHFDVGDGAYGKDWISELAILKVQDGNGQITDVWSRSNYLARLIFDLSDLCEAALVTVGEAVASRSKELEAALFKLTAEDAKFVDLIRKVPFDPVQFFQTQAGVDGFWSGEWIIHESYTSKMTTEESSVPMGPAVATPI